MCECVHDVSTTVLVVYMRYTFGLGLLLEPVPLEIRQGFRARSQMLSW